MSSLPDAAPEMDDDLPEADLHQDAIELAQRLADLLRRGTAVERPQPA